MYKLKIQNYDQQYLCFNSLGNILNVLSSVLCLIFKVEFKFEEELLLTCIEYSLLCSYFTTNVILVSSSKTIIKISTLVTKNQKWFQKWVFLFKQIF